MIALLLLACAPEAEVAEMQAMQDRDRARIAEESTKCHDSAVMLMGYTEQHLCNADQRGSVVVGDGANAVPVLLCVCVAQ